MYAQNDSLLTEYSILNTNDTTEACPIFNRSENDCNLITEVGVS